MTTNEIMFKTCTQCKQTLPTNHFYKDLTNKDKLCRQCNTCVSNNYKKRYIPRTKYKQNKKCPVFLGCHVAEQVLSNVFKNVETMPMCNPGYDFICNHGKKIDVKSSCKRKNHRGYRWGFGINHNKIADFFLCLAFDNRESLTPLHLWLIPGHIINDKRGVSISKSTVMKWAKYELDINQTLACCTEMKH